MHPLRNGSQATERPATKPLFGAAGWFTESGEDNRPSYPGADWFNHVIAEFLNSLAVMGVSFDPQNDDHFAKAFEYVQSAISPHSGIKSLLKVPGIKQTTLSFHTGLGVGGGDYIWLPDADQSQHLQKGPNGGILWASDAMDLFDGTPATLPALLNWVGVGNGCWEAIIGGVTLEAFGAVLNGFFDVSLSVNYAIKFANEIGGADIHWRGILGILSGLKARSGVTLIGQGAKASVVKTLPGFSGNIYETFDFDTLQEDQTADTSEGCPISYGIEHCSIDGDNYTGTVTADTGYGIRLYGRRLRLQGLIVGKTAGIGMYTEFPANPEYTDFDSIADTKFSVIKDISIEETGYEGFVFNGPTDQYLDNIYVGWPAGSRFDQFDATGPKTSLLFPGEQIHGFRGLRSTEFGFIHSYNNNYGYAVYIKKGTTDPAIRLRGNFLMGESSYGNVYIDPAVRYNINLIETHNNIGGPSVSGPFASQAGINPHVSLNSTLGGAAKIDIWRDGDENGSLAFDFKGSDHYVHVQVFGFSGTYTGGGDGINNEALVSKLRAMVVSANNSNRMGVGYNEANTVRGSDIDVTCRFCDVNVKFNSIYPSDRDNSYKIKCDRAATTDILNDTRIGRNVSKRSDITIYDGTNFLSNKFVGSAEVDFSSTEIQTVTLTHNLFRTPLEDEVSMHLSYNIGAIPTVKWIAVIGVTSTQITAQIWFEAGGSGTGRLNINVG